MQIILSRNYLVTQSILVFKLEGKFKVKESLCLTKRHAMKTYW